MLLLLLLLLQSERWGQMGVVDAAVVGAVRSPEGRCRGRCRSRRPRRFSERALDSGAKANDTQQERWCR